MGLVRQWDSDDSATTVPREYGIREVTETVEDNQAGIHVYTYCCSQFCSPIN